MKQNKIKLFFGIGVIWMLSFSGCENNNKDNENVTQQMSSVWKVDADKFLSDSQGANFTAGKLYYNVHTSAYPDGEIRGQLNSVKSEFDTSGNILSAVLNGTQEAPANSSNATGFGIISVNQATKIISGVILSSGINGTQAHIHVADIGVSGPVVIPFTGGPTVWYIADNTQISDENLTKLNSGGLYLNIHSTAFPNGEIRGQISVQQIKFALLNGANEVPPATSSATGAGILAFNPANKAITGFVRSSGITGIAAHIHVGATNVSGGVLFTLKETSSGSGVWLVPDFTVLSDEQKANLDANELYFNIHTTANPNGEIRGQISSAATITVRSSTLSGSETVPAINTTASGTGLLVMNSFTKEVFGDLHVNGIIGDAAHVHEGSSGENGPIIVPLTLVSSVNITTNSDSDGDGDGY